MRHRSLLLLMLSPLLFAEDQTRKVQRLEKVIWNPVTHVLSWQITEGHIDVHGQYEPERLVGSFFIEPQAAIMSFAGKKQGFMHEEGDHLHDILDSLSHYLMSSTRWWQQGEPHEARNVDAVHVKGTETEEPHPASPPHRGNTFDCSPLSDLEPIRSRQRRTKPPHVVKQATAAPAR